MKSLTAFTALTIFSGTVPAIDIYDAFSGPDNSPFYEESLGPGFRDPQPSLVAPTVSLYEFVAGNPDSDTGPIRGYVPISDPTAPRYTSLDVLTYGNPDSGAGIRIPPDVINKLRNYSFSLK